MARAASAFRLSTLAVLVAIAAGCAGDDEPLLQESQLSQLVLKPADLTQQWTQFDGGRQLNADALPAPRADPTRFERQGGWKARFRRPGSTATAGPLVVESRADLFAAVSGAEEDFEAAVDALKQGAASSQPVDSLELGDEARLTATGGAEPGALTTVTIVWREQNVVAAMTANGFSGKLVPMQVVTLARKQQQRLENALK